MDYKDKLKLAKEALDSGSYDKETIEYIFPELKESKDEKISREITEFILTHRIDEPNDIEDTNSWLVWLEKQVQSPVWGDNDRIMVSTLMRDVEQITYINEEGANKRLEWLKSLEDRFNKET